MVLKREGRKKGFDVQGGVGERICFFPASGSVGPGWVEDYEGEFEGRGGEC